MRNFAVILFTLLTIWTLAVVVTAKPAANTVEKAAQPASVSISENRKAAAPTTTAKTTAVVTTAAPKTKATKAAPTTSTTPAATSASTEVTTESTPESTAQATPVATTTSASSLSIPIISASYSSDPDGVVSYTMIPVITISPGQDIPWNSAPRSTGTGTMWSVVMVGFATLAMFTFGW